MPTNTQFQQDTKRIGDLRQIMRNTRPDSPMYQDAFEEMKRLLSQTPNAAWTVAKFVDPEDAAIARSQDQNVAGRSILQDVTR